MYAEQSGQDFGGGGWSRDNIYNATAAFGAWTEDTKAGVLSKRDYKSTNHLLVTDGGGLAFRKSRRAQTMNDDETWVEGDHANTLNSFDAGDVRTTHAILASFYSTGGSQGGERTDGVSPTLKTEPEMSVRRLTPTECERLMGWPDEWTAPEGIKAPDSKRYAACGDGIVAPVAFWIADRIRMIEGEA